MQPNIARQRPNVMADNFSEESDEALIKAATNGASAVRDIAFRVLIERYQGLVAQLVWRIIPNAEDREEICQDVFLKVYFNLEQFRFDSKFSTWLYTVAYRTSLSALRKKKLPTEEYDLERHEGSGQNQASFFIQEEISRELEVALTKLSTEERSIVTLYHFHTCTIEEIAKIVEKPSGTLKSLLFRIRGKLRSKLSAELIQEYKEA
ncbi:MAG: RNA polymerase sigma factor (sigma-70 family) [Candidatus Azotimanducaceae bacterium]|jgi:RNA polymerase sigma factor (sigma-70 family)